MDRKDIIIMSPEELRRISIVNQAIEGLIIQKKAAELIGVSDRQVRRVIKRVGCFVLGERRTPLYGHLRGLS